MDTLFTLALRLIQGESEVSKCFNLNFEYCREKGLAEYLFMSKFDFDAKMDAGGHLFAGIKMSSSNAFLGILFSSG